MKMRMLTVGLVVIVAACSAPMPSEPDRPAAAPISPNSPVAAASPMLGGTGS